MDRYEELPSGRTPDNWYWELKYHAFKKAKSIVKSLLKGYSLVIKDDAEGIGYMQHNNKVIVVNPVMYIAAIDPLYDRLAQQYPDDYSKRTAIWEKSLAWGFIGIVCHEIGHALYTLAPDKQKKYITDTPPEFFVHFCSNIVEDSYIQNKMKERFKWDLVRDGLNTSTALFQGLTTCEEFEKKDKYTAQDKLFYFILRSYNHNFAPPQKCNIPQDLIDDFLSFYYHNDKLERFKHTLAWSAKVYEWLKNEIQNEPQQPGQQGNGQGNGQGQSQGQGQGQQSQQGNGQGSGTGCGRGNNMTPEELQQAVKDLVDKLAGQTGVGSGADKSSGSFDETSLSTPTVTDMISICNGIIKVNSGSSDPLSDEARQVLNAYNLNFRRLQVYSFNGTAYNQPSGKLYQSKIYKSDISTKIFTRETGRKRDMDLYFGITLDASGSMSSTYYTLSDIIVPLLHSLNGIKAKSEMLVFSDDTVKVKDYFDSNLSTLYSTVNGSFFSNGTDLLPSLQYFLSVLKERNHKDRCIIVVTDGSTDNMQECADCIKALRKFNTCVVGIGLKLGDNPKWFTDLFGGDVLLYDSNEAIKNNIAIDLINYLSNKFMRR